MADLGHWNRLYRTVSPARGPDRRHPVPSRTLTRETYAMSPAHDQQGQLSDWAKTSIWLTWRAAQQCIVPSDGPCGMPSAKVILPGGGRFPKIPRICAAALSAFVANAGPLCHHLLWDALVCRGRALVPVSALRLHQRLGWDESEFFVAVSVKSEMRLLQLAPYPALLKDLR